MNEETVGHKVMNFEGRILRITEDGFYIKCQIPDVKEGMKFTIAKSDPALQNISAEVQIIKIPEGPFLMLKVRLLTREAKRHFSKREKVKIIVSGQQ